MTSKNSLLKGITILVIGFVVSSCADDGTFSAKDALNHAEEVLGVTIPSSQSWNMSSETTTNIRVNLGVDQNYRVGIYDVNPLNEDRATYYALEDVTEGELLVTQVSLPKTLKEAFVVVYDSRNRCLVKRVSIVNNTIMADFGDSDVAPTRQTWSARRKAIAPTHNFSADVPSKPSSEVLNNAAYFPNSIDGISYYKDVNSGNGYDIGISYIDDNVESINIWGGGGSEANGWQRSGGKLYVKGVCTFSSGSFSLADNTEIYLLKNAQLTIPQQLQPGCKVYMDEDSKLSIQASQGNGNIYYYGKKATLEVTGKLYLGQGADIIMEDGQLTVGGELEIQSKNTTDTTYCYLKNSTVHITGTTNVGSEGLPAVFYQEGGSFVADANLVCNSGKFVTDVNTTFTKIEVNTEGVVVNKSTAVMTSLDIIKVYNNTWGATAGSVLINDGTLIGNYLGTEGSGFFQNNGEATIYGKTIVNSNNNTWVNNGTYTTDYFLYFAGSREVINNCKMFVNYDFNVCLGDGDGAFRMDTGSSVVTKNFNGGGNFPGYNSWESFNGGPFYIEMGAKSVFLVTDTATMCATKPDYGIYGPETGDYAVFKAGKVLAGKTNQGFLITYGGNLAVVADYHFPQGNDGQEDHPFIDYKGNATLYVDGKNPAISINKTNCNPGFNPSNGGEISGEPAVWSYAFEDSWRADYDMNDAVIKVKLNAKNNKKLDVTLCCTGASYNLYLWLNETPLFGGQEIHKVLGGSAGKFINTGEGDKFSKLKTQTTTITKPSNFSFATADFWLESPEKKIHIASEGEDPHGVVIPGDWKWPKEYTCIKDAYPDFVNFAAHPENESYASWYKNWVAEKLY